MPHIVEALKSVGAQTYRNIELIIQDCCSTDGTLERIREFAASVPFPVYLVSEKDDGIADGINRAWARCNGSITALIEADNLLLPDHIQTGVEFIAENPDVTLAYTAQRIIDSRGKALFDWMPPEYDFVKMLECEIVPPSGSTIIRRDLAGEDLRYDSTPELGHVPDYEFWVRVGYRGHRIEGIPKVTYCTRLSDKSGSCQGHRYGEYVASKTFALERFFGTHDLSRWPEASLPRAKAGILLWAAYHVHSLDGPSERFQSFLRRAKDLDPDSDRLRELERRSVSGLLPQGVGQSRLRQMLNRVRQILGMPAEH